MQHHTRTHGGPDSSSIPALLTSRILVALLAAAFIVFPPSAPAMGKASSEQVTQRKKAQDLLDTAEKQLKRHLYPLAQQTLEKTQELNGQLSRSQKKRLESYRRDAQQGVDSQSRAHALIETGQKLYDNS